MTKRMIYLREFEFYNSDGYVLAVPCDMEGATFGVDIKDAATSAVDWLRETITDGLAHNRSIQGGTLGHKPEHGGQIVVIATDCELSPDACETRTFNIGAANSSQELRQAAMC